MAGMLSLLCLGFLASMLVPSMVLYGRQSSLAEAQQSAAVVMERLRGGVLSSLPETVSSTPGGQALAWRPGDSNDPFSPQGSRNLLGQFDVYTWQSDRATLSYTPWSPPGLDFSRASPLPEGAFPSAPQANSRIVARFVTLFRVSHPVKFPLQVELTLSPPAPKGRGQMDWQARASLMPAAARYPD